MTNINETLLRDTNIVFVEPIDAKLKCFICNNLLVNAHIAMCLHRYCKSCINNHLEISIDKKCIGSNLKCLKTELSLSNSRVLSRSFEINDTIQKLLVYCKISGCKKVIPLEDLENHLNTCDFRLVTCSLEFTTHLNNHGILICEELENNRNCMDTQKQDLDQLKVGPVMEREGQIEKNNKTACVIEIDDFITKIESLKKKGEEIMVKEESIYLKLRKFKMKIYLRRNDIWYFVEITFKIQNEKYEDGVNLEEKFIIEARVIEKERQRRGWRPQFVVDERLKEESEKEVVIGGRLDDFKNEILINNKLKIQLKIK